MSSTHAFKGHILLSFSLVLLMNSYIMFAFSSPVRVSVHTPVHVSVHVSVLVSDHVPTCHILLFFLLAFLYHVTVNVSVCLCALLV